MNLWSVFLTGLLTGGLTCLAVQGGLLAATVTSRDRITHPAYHILAFVSAKLVAYTILGFFLGIFGSFFQISITAQVILNLAVGIFMIGSGLNLLQVHPFFRYFSLQPPRLFYKLIRNQKKHASLFAPVLLGALTIFIPCGTTQAMMALAVGSGNPMQASAILFFFILGTTPLFFILGYAATSLTSRVSKLLTTMAASTVIILGILTMDNAIALSGSTVTLQSMVQTMYCTAIANCSSPNTTISEYPNVTNDATITIDGRGYTPDTIYVKAGSAVTLHLVNKGGGGCAAAFTIPKLNIQNVIQQGDSKDITFTAPTTAGEIPFMCSMNMFRGTIKVVV